jgi:hypothetical protein
LYIDLRTVLRKYFHAKVIMTIEQKPEVSRTVLSDFSIKDSK